ncbi:MAG: DUF1134 domain-containing protein [Sphingomonadaceae bacterium]|nr:DUF1134 domain-containing protein [Sphingomonadaceae bacterium]
MLKSFLKFAGAAALAAAAMPAAAQIQTVDPSQPASWQSAPPPTTAPAPEAQPPAADPQGSSSDYTPVQSQAAQPDATQPPAATTQGLDNQQVATRTTEQGNTVPRRDVFNAAEGVFGRGAQGLAHLLENILHDQGEPTAYIAGSEAGGAFILGVRYGSGVMHHQIEGDRTVYWTGPSIGFDAGADANKVFVLVYNLHDSQELFRRYPQAEGHAYFIGGFNAQYMRRGDVVLIPIRLGVGMRLGVNAGYMRFSEHNRWLPF